MSDILDQLRQLRTPEIAPTLTTRVLERVDTLFVARRRGAMSRSVQAFGLLVAAMSLAHAVWTVAFIDALAR